MSSKCFNCFNSEHPSIIRAWRQHCFINNTHPFMPVCECHIVGIVFCMRYTLHCRYQYTARRVFRTKECICKVLFCLLGVARRLFVSHKRFPWQNMLHAATTCQRSTSYGTSSKGHTLVGKTERKKVNVSQESPPPQKKNTEYANAAPQNLEMSQWFLFFAMSRIYPAWIRRCQI